MILDSTNSQSDLSVSEAEIAVVAHQLFVTTTKRSIFDKMRDQLRWDEKLLSWTMDNPGLRVQLFRLIDCLPALTTKTAIARHLQEYLSSELVELPATLKNLLNFTSPDSLPGQVAATTLATAVETLARKYIAGETLPQTIQTIEQLHQQSMSFTLDVLGEAVVTEAEAELYLQQYLELIDQLVMTAEGMSGQVSVKLTAFYSQFDPLDVVGSQAKVLERLRVLLRKAQSANTAVHFDMEQYRYKDATLQVLKNLLMEPEFRERSDIGMTLQAYLRDSYQDLQDLISWVKERGHPITLRLVKGAYWDQETILAQQNHWPTPVYQQKSSTDANFERMTQLLLHNHKDIYAAIGSHNVRSQAQALAIAQSLTIPASHLEFQVLYGMADSLATALVKQGQRVRVYCPYGALIPGMAYLTRRLLENTANSSFLKQSLTEQPLSELLAVPTWGVDDADGSSALVGIKNITGFDPAPDTNYAIAASRSLAQTALAKVTQQLGQSYWPLIAGERVQTNNTIPSLNPSHPPEIVGLVGQIDLEQADQAITFAQAAFPTWRCTSVADRVAIIHRVADLLTARRHELNAWMVLEAGKPLQQADIEVSEAIDFCRYYAAEMERLAREIVYDVAGETDRYFYRPKGIVLVVSPWNFPLAIPTGMVVAALVTGNCVLLKPAAPTAVIAAKLSEILVEAGIPAGVFQYLPGSGATVGAHLVQHPAVQMIVFTGSQEVGCQIYASAAIRQPGQQHLKKVVAEMGGKNAIIVDESADLDQAVQGILSSAFGYSGQKCSACSRLIVLAPIYDLLVARLIEATKSLTVGDAALPSTKVGPVIDAAAQQRIREMIMQGQQSGATLALELPSPSPGYFVGPVIFTDVDPAAPIAQTEIFGPVLAVIKAANFAEAVTIANGTNYALTGGLYSRTPAHIEQAKAELEVGNLYINRSITGAIVARQPFGGYKLSGVGSKAGGPDYLLQFLDPRTVTENIQRQGFAPIAGLDN
jgi:RHH-type transcriptional regulator, proline utilization regulon repressor / proline dehydrogenase / delta 1-pyrroline-5-carboxylate dehydrogenase